MKFKLLFTFLLFSLFSFSQTNYIKGFITKLSGEKEHGFIDFLDWKRSPREISFKKSLESKETIYNPSTILSFEVNNNIYESRKVKIDIESRRIQSANKDFSVTNIEATVFLKLIFKNQETKVYYYEDKTTKKHFYIDDGKSIYELQYTVVIDDLKKIEKKIFRNQLFKHLDECGKTKEKIANLQFFKRDLVNLFSYHSKCKNIKIDYIEKDEKLDFKFSIVAGVSSISSEFSTKDIIGGGNLKTQTNSLVPLFGVGLEIVFPKRKKRNSIYNEITYYSENLFFTHTNVVNDNQRIINEFNFSSSYIRILNSYRYVLFIKKIKPFVNLGIVNTIGFNEDLERNTKVIFFDNENSQSAKIDVFRNHQFTFVFGLGAKLNNLTVSTQFESRAKIDLSETIDTSNRRLSFSVGYNF